MSESISSDVDVDLKGMSATIHRKERCIELGPVLPGRQVEFLGDATN